MSNKEQDRNEIQEQEEGFESGQIRRVMVALDGSPSSLAALHVAAELASRFDAELLGLYVRDIHLLRLAELPFAQEISLFSMRTRRLSPEFVRQQLRMQARLARRAMAATAAVAHVRWTFHIEEGIVETQLLSAARETDIILLGRSGWSKRQRLGSTARAVAERSQQPAIVVQEGTNIRLPLGVVFDGSDAAKRSLEAAVHLLRNRSDYLKVLIVAPNSEVARELQREVSAWARDRRMVVQYRWLVDGDMEQVATIARGEQCGGMVVPVSEALADGKDLQDFLNQIHCPVLLVR